MLFDLSCKDSHDSICSTCRLHPTRVLYHDCCSPWRHIHDESSQTVSCLALLNSSYEIRSSGTTPSYPGPSYWSPRVTRPASWTPPPPPWCFQLSRQGFPPTETLSTGSLLVSGLRQGQPPPWNSPSYTPWYQCSSPPACSRSCCCSSTLLG